MGGDQPGTLDFDLFHQEELPRRLDARGEAFTAADASALAPLAFELPDGRAYTYVPEGRTFRVRRGSDGARTVVVLAEGDWRDFVEEWRSSFSLLYGQSATFSRGDFDQLARWEPNLRVVFDGQSAFDLDDPPPVLDGGGRPLDVHRRFTLDDGDAEIADFLHRAGFVHLAGVLDTDEVEALRAAADRATAAARPDDRRSWWTTVDGRDVCNRVTYLNEQAPVVAALADDTRFRRIGAIGGPSLRPSTDRLDGISLVSKVPGADSGLADLPWHRDCGMGGHPVLCPMINIGIQLDAATAASGQLHMIPGSHKGTSRLPGPDVLAGLGPVAIDTEPGDVTIHFGDTLHAAPPPVDPAAHGRRAIYLSFVPPASLAAVGPGEGYNDVVFTRQDGRIPHVDELA